MPKRPGGGPSRWLMTVGSMSLLMLTALPAATQEKARHGAYLRLLDTQSYTVDQVADVLAEAFAAQGLDVLANMPVALDSGFCDYGARILVLHDGGHALRMLDRGTHGAFAIPLRIAVYEDETGVHASAVNPLSLHRTMVAEDGDMAAEWAALADRLETVVAGRFAEGATRVEYGQWRDKGRIGRTFGIMAGGPFPEKVQTWISLPAEGNTVADVAAAIESGMAGAAGDWEWGMQIVYSQVLPEAGIALLGVTGAHMESRAFGIVKHGNQKEKEDLACPGLDRAAAFPIELVVRQVGEEIHVQSVDPMFRMKMYFEDAGKMSFAKNMGMPGSIKDEVIKKLEAVLIR